MSWPAATFEHLRRLTDAGGLYEHARHLIPRQEHGYCVDDVARALVVVCREDDPALLDLHDHYLAFLLAAQAADGTFRNRRSVDLQWYGASSTEDWWGRALWGLGAAATGPGRPASRASALAAFHRGAHLRAPWSRAMAFAGLGAAEVLREFPTDGPARELLAAAAVLLRPSSDPRWPWPEPRLRYANAVLPEVLLHAGALLGDPTATRDGLLLLRWLLAHESRDGHLSLVPVGGCGPLDPPSGLDQQPIEAAAIADACATAYHYTGDAQWCSGIALAAGWFLGANDAGTSLLDPLSGGSCDGLEAEGRNENQGAESTLAAISTFQRAGTLDPVLAGGRA